jgi:hypothetical protein
VLTIFSTCKPFSTEPNFTNQLNAIRSWKLLGAQVLLMGAERGSEEAARLTGCKYLPGVKCNEYGTPLIPAMFAEADKRAKYDILCCVNADIVLLPDFVPAIKNLLAFRQFLMIGRRWNWERGTPPIRVGHPRYWDKIIRAEAWQCGHRKKATGGSDYFVYRKGMYKNRFLPLVIGTRRWDLWAIGDALQRSVPVVDATEDVLAIHQWHPEQPRAPEEVKRNMEIVGPKSCKATVNDATWHLKNGGLHMKGN